MATEVKITFSRSALNDLEDVLDYYREQKVPQVGERLVAKIIKDIELLGKQPEMGRIVPEFELDYLRELILRIPLIPASHSSRSRSPIPRDPGHPFQ